MIEIKNLTKVYKSKHKNTVTALDNINLTLPNKGFVFILGKSGSGKSTLLNLISGIDSITSGDVVADGNHLATMKRKNIEKYLSSYLSFIFQDYHLIEQLTIKQNLSVVINDDNKDEIISSKLKEIGLEGYENRYPNQLSGGEKQRVAIIRALLKKPHVILADEPTGNLDKQSTKMVLDILKEISKEKLVIMVSHSLQDAELYGDRIIQLSEGKVIKDEVKETNYSNNFAYIDNTIYLPHNYDLNKKDIKTILDNKKDIKKIIQRSSGFKKAKKITDKNDKIKLSKSKTNKKDSIKLFSVFNSKNIFSKFIRTTIGALLISIVYLLFAINSFDGIGQTLDITYGNDITTVRLQKGVGDGTTNLTISGSITPIYGDYIDKVETLQSENKYYLYNDYLIDGVDLFGIHNDVRTLFSIFYTNKTLGTINCDEQFLIEKFGVDGKLKLAAGSISNNATGYIITDYIADYLLLYRNLDNYEQLLGPYINYKSNFTNGNITAIIDTGYKVKYKELYQIGQEVYETKNSNDKRIINHPDYEKFALEAYEYYIVTYNISNDYPSFVGTNKHRHIVRSIPLTFIENDRFYSSGQTLVYNNLNDFDLKDNEIAMSYQIYNSIFQTEYTSKNYKTYVSDGKPIKVYKTTSISNNTPINETEVVIKYLHNEGSYIWAAESAYNNMCSMNILPYAVYLDGNIYKEQIISFMKTELYDVVNLEKAANTFFINKALSVFKKFIWILEILLISLGVVYICSIGIKNIKSNYYEIGVLKAIGINQNSIGLIFGLQNLVIGIFLLLFSIVAIYSGVVISNNILIKSFEDVLQIKIYHLEIIAIFKDIILYVLLGCLFIVLITSIVPFIYLSKIKIINVLKAKE